MKANILQKNTVQKRIFFALAAAILSVSLLYVYFMSASVVHIVSRQHVEKRITDLSSRISELEQSYMSLSKEITRSYARDLGFDEPAAVSYTSRDAFAADVRTPLLSSR